MTKQEFEDLVSQVHVDGAGEVHRIQIPARVALFVARLEALARDPASTLREVEMMFYGPDNPILDHEVRPGRHVVTATTIADPAYLVMHDIMHGKRLAEMAPANSHPSRNEDDGEYLYLTEAHEQHGISISTIRKALQDGRIRGHKQGKSWRVLTSDLDLLKPRNKKG